jgi:DNA ligase-associated metallophosphoesterase
MGIVEIKLFGQTLNLLPDRAVMWREQRLLILADPHFGKAQVFRDEGIPVPAGATADDLDRLTRLIGQVHPRGLLFLGDLVHGPTAHADRLGAEMSHWQQRHRETRFYLAVGNHDRRAGDPPAGLRFDEAGEEIVIGPFVFSHRPDGPSSGYRIAGHLHPAVTLTGKGRTKESLPCFCFGPRGALLPSFGSFTGSRVVRPSREDRIYVVAGDEVVEIKTRPDS